MLRSGFVLRGKDRSALIGFHRLSFVLSNSAQLSFPGIYQEVRATRNIDWSPETEYCIIKLNPAELSRHVFRGRDRSPKKNQLIYTEHCVIMLIPAGSC